MLADPNTIDIVMKKDEMGRVGLVISAHEPWDARTLEQLRRKLANYISYIRGPQYRAKNGDASAFISLVSVHEATAEVRSLVTATAQANDIAIQTEVFVPPGYSELRIRGKRPPGF
jgi:hypothetical protein